MRIFRFLEDRVSFDGTETFYHHIVDHPAPYAWYDLPVLLGAAGGIGLLIGPAGLIRAKVKRDRALRDKSRWGMDIAFTAMLFLVSLTGLLLLVLRSTPAMGTMLAVHMGFVFGFFITIPYGKFVHGIHCFGALVRYAKERRALHKPTPSKARALAIPDAKAGR